MAAADQPLEAIPFVVDSSAAQSQIDFDIEFFRHVLRRNQHNVDVLRRQVELLARTGQYEEALRLDFRLVQLRPDDVIARYNLACTLSMVGDVEEALTVLDQALGLGYADLAHLETDPDLESVRELDGYQMVLAKHGHIVEF